jgi:hypothetical protein
METNKNLAIGGEAKELTERNGKKFWFVITRLVGLFMEKKAFTTKERKRPPVT